MADISKHLEALKNICSGTVTTILVNKGLRKTWMRGPAPVHGNKVERKVGRAFTLRFVPGREDLATTASWGKPISTRAAIEQMESGVIAVADAMGLPEAGIFGDILCMRMAKRGVSALITDGAVRDKVGVLATGLPVWAQGFAAPPSVAALTFVGWQEPIGCGGVAIFPDDIIVADDDGAVVIPAAMVEEVAEKGVEQERLEAWVVREVEKGTPLPGLYPMNEATKARYEAEKKK